MKVVTVCGMGMGTSLMLLMEIKDIAKKYNYQIEGEAVDLSTAKGKDCDVFVASEEIASQLDYENSAVISIKNLIDKDEIEGKIVPTIEALINKE